jgi:hypothetical protein
VSKANGTWGVTVDYCKLNYVETPIITAVPDVFSLLEKINTSSENWYAAIDQEKAILFILLNKDHKKQFAFSWKD